MDFITTFLEYTEGAPTPEIFRLWGGIAAVAGALERRVSLRTSGGLLFPNLFLLLVAPPGIGKGQTIGRVRDLWTATKKLKVAPNSVSKAGLLDRLVASESTIPMGDRLLKYSSLNVASTEFGTLVPAHDTEFLSVLIELFDCLPSYGEERRDKSRNVEIVHPSLHLIAGSQPSFLASLLPEEAWGMGFMSRMIMVYSATSPVVDIFDFSKEMSPLKGVLVERLRALTLLVGNMKIEEEYVALFNQWRIKEDCAPVPEHSKLQHYNTRRWLMALKLSMISALSRSEEMVVRIEDFHRAKAWLLGAENVMPDVFRDMVQKSDAQLIQDLHFFLWRLWVKEKKPLHEARLFNFLKAKTISERIPRIIDVAVRSGVLSMTPIGSTSHYIPRPSSEHGLE